MTRTALVPSSPSKCVAVNTRMRRSKDEKHSHDGDTNNEHIRIQCHEQKDQSLVHKNLEEKLMGHIEGEGRIGDSVERNINQMIEVLRSKIGAMENAAKTRLRLCQEDLNNNSSESSDQAPKITEDYEDSPKFIGTRDQDIGSYIHRDNLVFSEVVHINAAHLVIRTKAPTDAARKLELELEESYSSSKQRCGGNLAGKSGQKKIEISKKNVQKRSDAKKIRRNKSEKDLQTNMEKYLTRSVMDADLQFRAPIAFTIPRQGSSFSCSSTSSSSSAVRHQHGCGFEDEHVRASESCSTTITVPAALRQSSSDQMYDQATDAERLLSEAAYVTVSDEGKAALDQFKWPIAIKWPLGDPRSAHLGNAEGAMDPALLLRYAVERINLPSGEGMFLWLCRQPSIQEYYVYLFWLVKVKFFERSADSDNESYLLRGLSIEHVHIMELLGSYGRGAQYEKDFAYQYLPYVLANAIYYGFFYLCPGSRNIYTRAFKKTVLLQVVKIMHGVQLCNATVKVLWSRLFPEDTYEGDDASDEASEAFPVPTALNNELKYRAVSAGQGSVHPNSSEGAHRRTRTVSAAQTVPPLRSMTASASDVVAAAREASSAIEHCSSLIDSEPHKQVKETSRKPMLIIHDTTRQSFESQHASSSLHYSQSASLDSPRSRCPALSRSISDSVASLTLSSALHPDDVTTLHGPYMPHTMDDVVPCPIPSPCRSPLCSPSGDIRSSASISFSMSNPAEVSQKCSSRYDYPHDGSCEKGVGTPLSRTQLRAQTLPYGHKLRALCRRQATETINMKSVSPLIQEYFASSVKSPLKVDLRGQLMQRTVPVSWCATGGVDTHRTGPVYSDLHQTLTARRKESESEFLSASHLGRTSRIEKLRRANDSCQGLLHSNPASRSVFSRDVVDQQQGRRISSSSSSSRKGRATASKGDIAHVTPKGTSDSDLLSAKDALQSALFDPFELDSFIAAI